MKKLWIIAMSIAMLLVSCDEVSKNSVRVKEKNVERIEVFFRDFNVLSYMPYSESELTRLADVKLVLTQPNDMSILLSSLPKSCEQDYRVSNKKLNLYIMVVYYDSEKQIAIDRFSRFHYKESLSNATCRLDQSHRDQIANGIVILQKRLHKGNGTGS